MPRFWRDQAPSVKLLGGQCPPTLIPTSLVFSYANDSISWVMWDESSLIVILNLAA